MSVGFEMMMDQISFTHQPPVQEEPVNKTDVLRNVVTNHHDNLTKYSKDWEEKLDKGLIKMKLYDMELLKNKSNGNLYQLAQMMIVRSVEQAVKVNDESMRQHKSMHNGVSKIGKTIDRNFAKHVGGYFAREKDLVRDLNHRKNTCSVIFDFLLSEGCLDIAEVLKKEARLETKETVDNCTAFNRILNDIQRREIRSALIYLMEMAPHEVRLRYDLQKQYLIQLVINGKEKEARKMMRELRFFGNDKETQRLSGVLLLGSAALGDPRYKDMFDEKIWDLLTQRMADVMSSTRCVLTQMLETGRQTISALTGLKKMFGKSDLGIDEELPTEIKVKRQIHSTFTCPILKEQSSQRNPPMKLICGHVISRDAMQTLLASRQINSRVQMPRQARFKCPYCPKEQSYEAAKQVLFSHVQF